MSTTRRSAGDERTRAPGWPACSPRSASRISRRRRRSTRSIPAELPGSPRFYTYASGVAELGTAALLAAPRTRRLGATLAIALFVAVFPANLNLVRLWWDKPWPMRLGAIARLPLQIPMITAANKVRRVS